MLAHLKSCGFGGVPLTVGRYSREISILYSHENYPQAGVSTYFTILCVPVHHFEKFGGALCFIIIVPRKMTGCLN